MAENIGTSILSTGTNILLKCIEFTRNDPGSSQRYFSTQSLGNEKPF